MKFLREVLCIQSVIFLFLVQSSFAQTKNLADAFVNSAPGKAAKPGDPASHRKAVEELFNQINLPMTLDQTVAQVSATLTGVVPEDAGYRDAVDAYVHKYVGWDAMKDEVIALYIKTFTEKEIWDLISFYNTTAGRKLLEQSPAIGQAISASVHKRLVEHSPELKKMMMDADFKAFKQVLGQDNTPSADKR